MRLNNDDYVRNTIVPRTKRYDPDLPQHDNLRALQLRVQRGLLSRGHTDMQGQLCLSVSK